MNRILRGVTGTAVLTLILGIVLALMPGLAAGALVSVLGWALLLFGLVCLVKALALRSGSVELSAVLSGLLALASGLLLLIKPNLVVSLLGIGLGLLLIVHGLQDIQQAREARAMGYDGKLSLIVAVITLIMGALLLLNPFSTTALLIRMAGIFLIVDALGDLALIRRIS